jgi:hypothetical protein
MRTEFELVVVQQDEGDATRVASELTSLGSGFTLVQLSEPSAGASTIDIVFTALARNQATQRSQAEWLVFLDARLELLDGWLEQLVDDLVEADAVASPVSVADDGSTADLGRRADIAYRRDFLRENGGFPIGLDVSGQEDLMLGVRCLLLARPIARGRRRSQRASSSTR